MTEEQEKLPKRAEDRYVISERRVDNNTVVRRRVRVTPAVCTFCGTDLAQANRLPVWEELSPGVQASLEKALEQHKKLYHTKSEARILRESEMRALGHVD